MKQTVIILLLTLASFAVVGCSPDQANAQPAAASAPPASVATPLVETVAVTRTYPAHVEPVERVELRPQVSGYLDAIRFTEGSIVRKGQILFRIDPRPYAAALAEAEATLAQTLAEAEADAKEGERAGRLLERKAISQEDADRRVASAGVAAARIQAAAAAVERARLNLSFTEVRSPITGRIGRAEITSGNLVSPETRLAVIVSSDDLYVRFDVDENTLSKYGGAQKEWRVAFTRPGSSAVIPATIAFGENEIGRGTGTLRLRARLEGTDPSIVAGMFGNVELTVARRADALLIREEAIGTDQGQRYVLVADDSNVLQYRPVIPGARKGALRVIESGLEPQDRVVINGLFRLRPGTPVTPQPTSMEKES